MFFSPNYDLFSEEEKFKIDYLTPLMVKESTLAAEIVRLNSSLVEKANSLADKSFNMPLLTGNKAIKIPLYETIKNKDDENFLFKAILEKMATLSTTYQEMDSASSSQGKLRDFFSEPAKPEENSNAETSNGGEAVPSSQDSANTSEDIE